MAGAFGYEKEHYEVSVQVGEQNLLPAVLDADRGTAIVVEASAAASRSFRARAGRRST